MLRPLAFCLQDKGAVPLPEWLTSGLRLSVLTLRKQSIFVQVSIVPGTATALISVLYCFWEVYNVFGSLELNCPWLSSLRLIENWFVSSKKTAVYWINAIGRVGRVCWFYDEAPYAAEMKSHCRKCQMLGRDTGQRFWWKTCLGSK